MPTIKELATFSPPVSTRTWLSNPHPHLPLLATACSDKTVRIYSLHTFTQQCAISGGHKRSIRSCAWKPNSVGESVLATGSFDASCGIWKRWEEGAGTGRVGAIADGGGHHHEVDFTGGPTGGGGDRDDDDEEEEEWRLEVILDGHDSEIKSVAFCPTAPLLATCSRDRSVWVWEELDEDNFETVAVLQDHEGDVKTVAWHPEEQLLASGSYDDRIRLWREDVDDWTCCTLLDGHEGTVWWVEFEPKERVGKIRGGEAGSQEQEAEMEERVKAGARLMSCSDDKTIRVWRRKPKEKLEQPAGQGRVHTIWKNRDFEETWIEESRLPQVHERPIYSVSWSKKTGRVVSAGSDGLIFVYEERWKTGHDKDTEMTDSPPPPEAPGAAGQSESTAEWVVVAQIENAHDVFEVNHVVWCARYDKGRTSNDEEMIISTGDDGEVKAWAIED